MSRLALPAIYSIRLKSWPGADDTGPIIIFHRTSGGWTTIGARVQGSQATKRQDRSDVRGYVFLVVAVPSTVAGGGGGVCGVGCLLPFCYSHF
jgi:hypothetical protein